MGALKPAGVRTLSFRVLGERFAVCRLGPRAEVPAWATAAPFYSITRTPNELSVVCPEKEIPGNVVAREDGWRALELDGPFDFGEIGVLVSVAVPLAEAGVVILAISTHDTDYVLVKESQLDAAIAALWERGHKIGTGGPDASGNVTIRPATAKDEPFLWEMLAEAAHEASVRAVMENPGTAKYVEGWDPDGDLGFVAEAAEGEPLGAAWLRLLKGENRGYGYLDDETPELAIAVRAETRGAGIGACLISRLLEAARGRYRSVSLSVRKDNPARRLYERTGFRAVEPSERTNRVGGTSITMRLDLYG